METIFMWGIGILILWIYFKITSYYYKKDKMKDAGFLRTLIYLFFGVLLFIFPYLSLLGQVGFYLSDGHIQSLKFLGKYLWGTIYVLSIFAVMLAFFLFFLIVISLIIKLLSDFFENR